MDKVSFTYNDMISILAEWIYDNCVNVNYSSYVNLPSYVKPNYKYTVTIPRKGATKLSETDKYGEHYGTDESGPVPKITWIIDNGIEDATSIGLDAIKAKIKTYFPNNFAFNDKPLVNGIIYFLQRLMLFCRDKLVFYRQIFNDVQQKEIMIPNTYLVYDENRQPMYKGLSNNNTDIVIKNIIENTIYDNTYPPSIYGILNTIKTYFSVENIRYYYKFNRKLPTGKGKDWNNQLIDIDN